MKKTTFWLTALLTMAVSFSGCMTAKEALLPIHDEVLVYSLPYDLTYLRTLEAVENIHGWELEETEKEKGIIRASNINYGRFDDADERRATLVITRLNRHQTQVALAPTSQRVREGDKLLQQISQFISREL